MVRSSWIAIEITGWNVPFALVSLLSGLVMAFEIKSDLFRHYWVLFSLVQTTFANAVLLLNMPNVSSMADLAKEAEGATLD